MSNSILPGNKPRAAQGATLLCLLVVVIAGLTACNDTPAPNDAGVEDIQRQNIVEGVASAQSKPSSAQHNQSGASWQEIAGGDETTCSDGSPYKFFVRQGHADKLMVYLQGGGACWFRQNCDPQMQPSYTINIGDDFKPSASGIFNFSNSDNPFADYTVVMAPYCTGDVHLGATSTEYPAVKEGQQPLTVEHQGRANMQAVLEWTFDNVASPERIFVTGSSAGAIPSPFYTSIIANHYGDAKIAHLGDAAGGYRRLNQDARPDQQWGTFSFLTRQPGFENEQPNIFNYERLYIAAAKAHPEIMFAEYDAAEDQVQKAFLALGGSTTNKLIESLQANHADIRQHVENFRAYIGGGESHTILLRPEFYNYASNGIAIRDWVTQLANFEDVTDVTCQQCDSASFAGPPLPPTMQKLWNTWQDPKQQYVEPFKIFDNVYYVGIDWVAAYVIKTSEGLILIDSLYGKWVPVLLTNIAKLGLNPKDIKYVINTHGHFDHAGGSALIQHLYGARVVMTQEDWQLAETKPDLPMFYNPAPDRDIVAHDGDAIVLGDTKVELFNTPGHTEGVLTLRYQVRDGDTSYTAITLGGVGLNFSGVERTETYLDSYHRLKSLESGVSVSLPNHASMAAVFQRAERLHKRKPGDPHPFVDAQAYQASLTQFITNAEQKLAAEKTGTAKDPLEALTDVLDDE